MAFDPSGLKASQKDELKELLLTKLEVINKDIADLEADIKDDGTSAEQSAPDDFDRSSFEEGMQRTQLLLAGKLKLKRDVQVAIEKFEQGTYGICEESEEPIGYKRLKAQPWTKYTLESQEDLEADKKIRAARRPSHSFSGMAPEPGA